MLSPVLTNRPQNRVCDGSLIYSQVSKAKAPNKTKPKAMKVSEEKLRFRPEYQDKFVISQVINQATTDLIGGIWTDKYGKIHYVGLVVHSSGVIMPDFPQDTYIADVAQVGIKRKQ